MKKRCPSIFMCKESFAHLFLCLRLYEDIYEDGSAEADAFLQTLVQVFAEEHKEVLNYDNAYRILSEKNKSKKAGRKPLLSDKDKQEIRQIKDSGVSAKKLAAQFNVSVRTVYSIWK